MMSGIFDMFSSSDKSKNFEEHILPIPQHSGRPLTYTDCFTWLNQKVVVLLLRFDNPQIGTVKYIGSDDRGNLCAGIEFQYNVGGMSGKIHGQKLFKAKSGHGLLIPVEYVRLLADYEDGRNIFPVVAPSTSSSQVHRAQSVPSNMGTQIKHNPVNNIPLEDYIPLTLPSLSIGSNVVWLGGSSPQTGIVRWIGKAGRSDSTPIKVWVEMDDFMGYGHSEMDSVKFGCASGRGKLFPADELILLENFLPSEQTVADTMSPQKNSIPLPAGQSFNHMPVYDVAMINGLVENKPSVVVPESFSSPINKPSADCDLIDFSESENLKITPEGNSMADLEFRRIMKPEEPMETNETLVQSDGSISPSSNEFAASAPPLSLPNDSVRDEQLHIITANELMSDVATGNAPVVVTRAVVLNGCVIPDKVLAKLVDDKTEDYLPPFIVPPIDILEFFRAEGQKGIQGMRNSCYIDVVLFSMFAFTDTFDPYFLDKNNLFNKVPDSVLTKTAKKVLAENIVNPLRQNYYCPGTGVNSLRELMIPFSDKLDGAFMDVEELMLIMFDKLFQLKEFITYDNGVRDYLHQVNLGDQALAPVITLKQCLEMSFQDYNLKLQCIPSPAFIIEIPRHHHSVIQSTVIVPNLTLNMDSLLSSKSSDNSNTVKLMNLVAVVCILDFHFVTFVKCGKGVLSHWVLFDSNPSEERPKVDIVTNMGECLESLEHQVLTNPAKVAESKHKLPPLVQKLLSDIYVCIYCPASMV